jgi:hypothetical protein
MHDQDTSPRRLYEIAEANTPPNVRYVPCSDPTSTANYDTCELTAPPPDSLENLLTYLHECAHFHLHRDAQPVPYYLKEFQAETWALRVMKEARLCLTDEFVFKSRRRIANCIVGAFKNKIGKPDKEAVEFAWSAFDDFDQTNMDEYPDIRRFTDEQICKAIADETAKIMDFWKNDSDGWAPAEVAGLLTRSMLDRQSSLACALKIWLGRESDGELILAWVNLGSLVEGMLKLFLCVHYTDYVKDENAWKKKGELEDVDGLEFDKLRKFFKATIWPELEEEFDWDDWIQRIQWRRNTVHAYQKREIGSFEEWRADLRIHLRLIRTLDSRLPYP